MNLWRFKPGSASFAVQTSGVSRPMNENGKAARFEKRTLRYAMLTKASPFAPACFAALKSNGTENFFSIFSR
jgi:hypothetical protein